MKGAVLDLGSNSIKLLLAEQKGSSLYIYCEKAFITRLGEGVTHTHKLNPRAITDSLSVLKKCRKIMDSFGVETFVATGTSALRSAKNRSVFLLKAKKILGQPVKIISGKKEGELIYTSISSNPKWKDKNILNLDLGGGSLEFIHGKKGKLLFCKSTPIGCVRIREKFISKHPVKENSLQLTKEYLEQKLSPITRSFEKKSFILTSSGGTMNELCAMQNPKLSHKKFEGKSLSKITLQKMLRKLMPLKLSELKKIKRLNPQRTDIIIPGIFILLSCMKFLDQKRILCSSRGLRYGIWIEYVSKKPFKKIFYKK